MHRTVHRIAQVGDGFAAVLPLLCASGLKTTVSTGSIVASYRLLLWIGDLHPSINATRYQIAWRPQDAHFSVEAKTDSVSLCYSY